MPAKRKRVEPIPDSFASPEEAGQFWDDHDLGDYWNQTKPVEDIVFDIKRRRHLVSVEPSLSKRLSEAADRRGVTGETLVNLWIKEKLEEFSREPTGREKPAKRNRKTA